MIHNGCNGDTLSPKVELPTASRTKGRDVTTQGKGALEVVFRVKRGGSTEVDLYRIGAGPKLVYGKLEDIVSVPGAYGGPIYRSARGWAWEMSVKEVRALLGAGPEEYRSFAWVVEGAKTGGDHNCCLPLGIAAWLMGLRVKIRLNETEREEKPPEYGGDPAWIALEEWQREALALVRNEDDGKVLR
jgi:hypothetical protein